MVAGVPVGPQIGVVDLGDELGERWAAAAVADRLVLQSQHEPTAGGVLRSLAQVVHDARGPVEPQRVVAADGRKEHDDPGADGLGQIIAAVLEGAAMLRVSGIIELDLEQAR